MKGGRALLQTWTAACGSWFTESGKATWLKLIMLINNVAVVPVYMH